MKLYTKKKSCIHTCNNIPNKKKTQEEGKIKYFTIYPKIITQHFFLHYTTAATIHTI